MSFKNILSEVDILRKSCCLFLSQEDFFAFADTTYDTYRHKKTLDANGNVDIGYIAPIYYLIVGASSRDLKITESAIFRFAEEYSHVSRVYSRIKTWKVFQKEDLFLDFFAGFLSDVPERKISMTAIKKLQPHPGDDVSSDLIIENRHLAILFVLCCGWEDCQVSEGPERDAAIENLYDRLDMYLEQLCEMFYPEGMADMIKEALLARPSSDYHVEAYGCLPEFNIINVSRYVAGIMDLLCPDSGWMSLYSSETESIRKKREQFTENRFKGVFRNETNGMSFYVSTERQVRDAPLEKMLLIKANDGRWDPFMFSIKGERLAIRSYEYFEARIKGEDGTLYEATFSIKLSGDLKDYITLRSIGRYERIWPWPDLHLGKFRMEDECEDEWEKMLSTTPFSFSRNYFLSQDRIRFSLPNIDSKNRIFDYKFDREIINGRISHDDIYILIDGESLGKRTVREDILKHVYIVSDKLLMRVRQPLSKRVAEERLLCINVYDNLKPADIDKRIEMQKDKISQIEKIQDWLSKKRYLEGDGAVEEEIRETKYYKDVIQLEDGMSQDHYLAKSLNYHKEYLRRLKKLQRRPIVEMP